MNFEQLHLPDDAPAERIETEPETEQEKKKIVTTYSDEYRDALIQFYRELQEEYPETKKQDENKYIPKLSPEDPRTNYWLAVNEDNGIDGTMSLQDFGDDVGYVSLFYVKKDKRNGSVGGRLAKTMLKFAKDQGYKKLFGVTMPGNEAAQKIYGKRMKKVEKPPSDKYSYRPGTIFFETDLTEDMADADK